MVLFYAKYLLLGRLNFATSCTGQTFLCKAEDGAVASASAMDGNAADGDLGKQNVATFNRRSDIIIAHTCQHTKGGGKKKLQDAGFVQYKSHIL